MNGEQLEFDVLDILNVLSFMLGIENLQENRTQSAHNDVQAANQQQAEYLLGRSIRGLRSRIKFWGRYWRGWKTVSNSVSILC